MDKIFFRHFELSVRLGVYPHEKQTPQPITLDLEFDIDARKAARHDALMDTINYADVKQVIESIAYAQHYELIETLAERIAQQLLMVFDMTYVWLRITKLQVFADIAAVGVVIERYKNGIVA